MATFRAKHKRLVKQRDRYLEFLKNLPEQKTEYENLLPADSVLKLVNEVHRLNMAIKSIEKMNMLELRQDAGDYEISTNASFG